MAYGEYDFPTESAQWARQEELRLQAERTRLTANAAEREYNHFKQISRVVGQGAVRSSTYDTYDAFHTTEIPWVEGYLVPIDPMDLLQNDQAP